MEVQTDLRDLLALFNKHDVEYLIVGDYAMAFHGVPRFTGDIDLFVHPEFSNARRILDALDEFGFGSMGLTVKISPVPIRPFSLVFPLCVWFFLLPYQASLGTKPLNRAHREIMAT